MLFFFPTGNRLGKNSCLVPINMLFLKIYICIYTCVYIRTYKIFILLYQAFDEAITCFVITCESLLKCKIH